MRSLAGARPPWAFFAATGAVYAAALWIVTILEHTDRPDVVAAGVTFDLTLLVPALYWWSCVRRRGWPWITLVPVVVLSWVLASWIVPPAHHAALDAVSLALAPLELVLLGYVGWQARRAVLAYRVCRGADGGLDAIDAIRETARRLVRVPWVARALAYELSVLYLALFGWRLRPASGDRRFTCYREASYGTVLAVLTGVMLLEVVGVHVALWLWIGPAPAWIVSGLSLYAALWLLGDYQALRSRPIVVERDRLRLRIGLRLEADVPLETIRSLEPAGAGDRADVKAVVFGAPNLRLQLHRPVRLRGPYGIGRRGSSILLAVDSPERFRREVARCRL